MKRLLSLLLCSAFMITALQIVNKSDIAYASAGNGVAQTDYDEEPVMDVISAKDTSEVASKGLEEAIKAVKAKICIPNEYSEFEYNLYNSSYYEDSYWRLNWRNPEDYSYIQVSCDMSHNIMNYRKNDNSQIKGGVPVYLKKELLEEAEKFIKHIAPKTKSKLKFVDSSYDSIYSGTYSYYFQRIENGVIFPDNSVEVAIDGITGEVIRVSINWLYDVDIPSANTTLTKDEAAKLIGDNIEMVLAYKHHTVFNNTSSEYVQKAFLVYEPSDSYISINAKTGEAYFTRSEWIERVEGDGGIQDSVNDESASNKSSELTEEEIEKIKELKKLISKEKAIKLVTNNPNLYIEDSLTSYSANLNKISFDNDTNYVWNITLRDPRPIDYDKDVVDYHRAYADAQVDAKTGKVLRFYANIKSHYDEKNGKWNEVNIEYSKEECLKHLEEFLKSEIKNKFINSTLASSDESYVAYYKDDTPVYGGYNYQYKRVNEEIIYPYNGINASVDGVTGKIYNYNYNWNDDVVFESPKGAMTSKDAFDHYISKEGYNLVYEVNEITTYDPNYKGEDKYYDDSNAYTVDYQVRLVYRPDINPYYISPFSGEQLTYSGEVYTRTKPYNYVDIPDHETFREILLLSDMNIGFEGEYFYPDKNITHSEINELLNKLNYYKPVEEGAIVTDELMTREELAVKFIDILGLDQIAALKGIYNTGYFDQYDIDLDYYGSVALCKGLGLIDSVENNMFYPKNNITRKEAVHLILNFITVQRNMSY